MIEQKPSISIAARILLPALLFVVTLALYAPVVRYEFLNYDDEDYVTQNLHVQEGLTPRSMWWALTSLDASNWHPLTWLSLQLDAELFGIKCPGAFHLTSAMLHALNVVILYCFLLMTTGLPWRSAFVAALFGWHPLRVESVAWIAERKDVLSALFWLLTMVAYARYARRPSAGRYVLAVVLFAAGLMAKPMLVTLPVILLLLDYWPLGRLKIGTVRPEAEDEALPPDFAPSHPKGGKPDLATSPNAQKPDFAQSVPKGEKQQIFPSPLSGGRGQGEGGLRVVEKLPFCVLSAISIAVTLVAQQHGSAINAIAFSLRWRNAIVSYVTYLRKMLWPVDLAVFYPHPVNGQPLSAVITASLMLVAITIFVLWCHARRPYLAIGWFWYVISMLPVIGLIQVGAQAYADRYTYLPMIGIYLMLVWGLADVAAAFGSPREVMAVLAAVVLIACLTLTWGQLAYWHDSVSLWRHTTAVTAPSYVGELNYGAALAELDRRNQSTKYWPDAKLHFERAMQLDPAPAGAYLDYALGMARTKSYPEAIQYFKKALAVRPNFPQAHNSLGKTLLDLGHKDEAIEQFRLAVGERPDYSMYHYNLGIALEQKGNREEAIQEYELALRLKPDHVDAQTALRRARRASR
jgi:hypothetical protein